MLFGPKQLLIQNGMSRIISDYLKNHQSIIYFEVDLAFQIMASILLIQDRAVQKKHRPNKRSKQTRNAFEMLFFAISTYENLDLRAPDTQISIYKKTGVKSGLDASPKLKFQASELKSFQKGSQNQFKIAENPFPPTRPSCFSHGLPRCSRGAKTVPQGAQMEKSPEWQPRGSKRGRLQRA